MRETENNNNLEEKRNNNVNETKNRKIIPIKVIGVIVFLTIIGIGLFIFLNKSDLLETLIVKNETNEYTSEYKMTGNGLENFDLQFLKLETENQNIVYSPLSIKYALAMLSAGTIGNSKIQIDALIGDYKTNKYNNSNNMSFANAMFVRNTYSDYIKEKYVDDLYKNFNAEVIYDTFDTPNTINSWVKDKTLGLVDNLVNDVASKDFYLINALAIDMEWNNEIQLTTNLENRYSIRYKHENYFEDINAITDDKYDTILFDNKINSKAVEIGASINNYDIVSELGEDNIRATITEEYSKWLEEYEYVPDDAEDVETYVNRYIEEINSNYKKVDVSTDFKFYNDEKIKVFAKELKEYDNTTLEYISIMPKNKTLAEYIKDIDAEEINETIGKIKSIELDNFEKGKVTKITGGIPLFKYEYELNLKNDLNNLGITDIFAKDTANLSGMISNNEAVISDVSHKSNIEFSNQGIKAAAVTSLGGIGSAGGGFEHLYEVPIVIIDLNFDNPYLYIIRDKNSGEVWFIGTVYEPIENNNDFASIINE